MSITLVYDTVLSRVRITGTALAAGTAHFERSPNGQQWTTVRGGEAVPIVAGQAQIDDYEFMVGDNEYRVTSTGGGPVHDGDIEVVIADVWIKNISRPFLNRIVQVADVGPIRRRARTGVFPIIGRTYPVAVTDVRLAREWTVTLKVDTVEAADALDLVFASGDPMLIQVPATGPYSTLPAGYVVAGDLDRTRYGSISPRRWFTTELTEVAPPGPGVYGLPATWETIVAEFGTWADVYAAFGTWADVAEYISSGSVVIVP